MKSKVFLNWVFFACLTIPMAWAEPPKPKYGPEALVITKAHDYFKRASAPDFWALMPYYAAQQDESSCSVASVTMIVNGARAIDASVTLTADDELATQEALVKKVQSPAWHKAGLAAQRGYATSLDELGDIVKQAFEAYGIKTVSVEVVHAEESPAAAKKLHEALVLNEKSARDFILINFNQQTFTGDTDVGHIAPIGAYDSKTKRVLVLDPDRKWYEPYWVSEETLLKGISTKDASTGKSRGYVYVKF